MINNKLGLLVLALGLAFMFSGCGDGGKDGINNSGDPVENPADDPTGGGDESLESIVEQLEQIPDHPPVIRLHAEPAVSSPDGTVNFSTTYTTLSGRMILMASDGDTVEADFMDGQGSLNTSGLADGLYPVWVEEADGEAVAVGSIRISSEPGIWLSADRRYVAPGETAELRVDTIDLPESDDFPILSSLLEGTPELPPEWEQSDLYDLHLRSFVPDSAGNLVPGYRFATPVATFTDRTLYLDSSIAGTFQVAALLDYDSFETPDLSKGDAWLSNSVTIQECGQMGVLSGNAGGAGIIRIFSIESADGIYLETEGGPFEVELPAGRALVLLPDGSEPVVVDIPCGAAAVLPAVTLSSLSVSAAAEGPSSAAASPGADACRTVYVDSIESTESDVPGDLVTELLATRLHSRLVRASVTDANTVKDLLGLLALQQLTGVPEDSQVNFPAINDAIGSDFLVHGRISRAGQSLVVTFVGLDLKRQRTAAAVQNIHTADGVSVYGAIDAAARQFAEEMVGAAVCATVEPAQSELRPGASLALTVQAEDLAGNPLEAGDVSASEPACGTLDPRSGALAEGAFETSYTAEEDATCKEAIEFDVMVSRHISTNPGEVIANIDLLPLWNFGLTLDVASENSVYQWSGTFTVEEGRISGSGSGSLESASECTVYIDGGIEQKYPYQVDGSFEFDLVGEQRQQDWGEEFRLEVLGHNTQIDQQFPAECGEELFGDLAESFMTYVAEYPQFFAQQGDPPTLPVPAVDQGEAIYPIPDSDGVFTVTVSTEAAP